MTASLDGIGDLVSSVVVGIVFTVTDPAWGFVYAAVLATLGAVVLARGSSRRAIIDAEA